MTLTVRQDDRGADLGPAEVKGKDRVGRQGGDLGS
jgi:hypothetical protein